MQLFMLMCGKSKGKMKPIMIDERRKCENYMAARVSSKSTKAGWYDIVPAPKGAKIWRKDTTNKWTNYNVSGPMRVK